LSNCQLVRDRVKRKTNTPKMLEFVKMVAYALNTTEAIEADEPSTYRKAMACTKSSKWSIVMEKEIESFENNRTWELVKLSKEKRSIG